MPKFTLPTPIKTDVPVMQIATVGDTDRAQVIFQVPVENDQGIELMTIALAPIRADDKTHPDDIRQKIRDVAEYVAKLQGALGGDALPAEATP